MPESRSYRIILQTSNYMAEMLFPQGRNNFDPHLSSSSLFLQVSGPQCFTTINHGRSF